MPPQSRRNDTESDLGLSGKSTFILNYFLSISAWLSSRGRIDSTDDGTVSHCLRNGHMVTGDPIYLKPLLSEVYIKSFLSSFSCSVF